MLLSFQVIKNLLFQKLIKQARELFYQLELEKVKYNMKTTWNMLNEITAENSSTIDAFIQTDSYIRENY